MNLSGLIIILYLNILHIKMNKPDLTCTVNGTKNLSERNINVLVISRDSCSECDELIKNLMSLKMKSPEIRLEVLNIDSEEIKPADFPFIVYITPALLVNGKLKCYGSPSLDKIKKIISN
jgi:predicted thioredoxin/glutaredoxin